MRVQRSEDIVDVAELGYFKEVRLVESFLLTMNRYTWFSPAVCRNHQATSARADGRVLMKSTSLPQIAGSPRRP